MESYILEQEEKDKILMAKPRREARLHVSKATPKDVDFILAMIKELAVFENLEHEATPELLIESLFPANKRPVAEAIIASLDSHQVGFAIFFHNYSTWEAKKGLYLEDLYVKQEERGKGVGKRLLKELAKIAVERDCGRFEWAALDWNSPAIEFYKSMGAKTMDGWTVFRLDGEALVKAAIVE